MTTTDPTTAARAVAGEAARTYQDVFTERLVAVYLLGSLAYGGYAPAVSDIDLAVVLTDTRDGDAGTIQTTREPLHRRLSVFWGSLPALREGRDDGRFPALDRLELADRGVLLLGGDVAREVARPGTDELLVESARFAVDVLGTDEVVSEFHRPRRLLADPVWFTKAVLFPVRFLHTSTQAAGRAASNDEAVAWYLGQRLPAASLVRLAQRVRAGDPLDPVRAGSELSADLVSLYQRYIDGQLRLLRRAGAPGDLVAAFAHWAQRLRR